MRCCLKDIPDKYTDYARKVIDNQIVAGKAIKQVAQRFLDFLNREDVYFDTDKADRPVNFIKKLRHTESPFTGLPFILEPWQQFVVYCIFILEEE